MLKFQRMNRITFKRKAEKSLLLILFLFVLSFQVKAQPQPALGDGTSGNPYQIATLDDLKWIANQVNGGTDFSINGNFIQTANIDASAMNSGVGWIAIGGTDSYYSFSGSYNGQGYTISNLYINNPSANNYGLFGYCANATIKNLGLTNVSITAGDEVGGLVGYMDAGSTVSNCYVTGVVSSSLPGVVGGLLGEAFDATITDCYAECTISEGAKAGGLIGMLSGGSLSNSYASGSITASQASYIGGLIGGMQLSAGNINSCYSSSAITINGEYSGGKSFTGGFVGYIYQNALSAVTISDCYATGSISGTNFSAGSRIGGFIGENTSTVSNCYTTVSIPSTVATTFKGAFVGENHKEGPTDASHYGVINTNCFWNLDVYANGYGDNTGATFSATGKTTAAMQTQSTFTGWDFPNLWKRIDTKNNKYPYLEWQVLPFTAAVSTTAISTYGVTSATMGGNITADGGATVTERGVVYSSTDATPTIGETGVTKNANGTGIGTFSKSITGLSGNTTYNVCAYATNSAGTSYGMVTNFTTLVAVPTVTGISLTNGPTAGGTTVTITGTNLTAATAVNFGGNAGSVTANTATSITVTSPAGSVGKVDITVTTAGGTSATSDADQFTYVAAPTITGISTTSGPTVGSTTVVITGTNFLAASAVKFGSTNATGYTINSATQITATSPAGSAGAVDITVTTAGGTSATSGADQFTYLANPVISVSGVTAGGLATAIVATGGDLATVTNLTVTGTIDARDFKAMRDNMPLLATLDLSGATIAAYSGTDGTVTESTTYPANEIPQRAFQTKISLASIKMPSSITAIGYAAFYNCNHLTGSLTIPSSVNSIGLHAFGNCTGLTGSLTIPSLVTSIGAFAFNNCTGLTGTLTIPTSVTSIEASAFISCSNLSSIKMDGAIPTTVGSGVFNGISRATCKLTVPTAFYLNYSVASQWKDFFFVNTPSPATLSSFSTRVGTASDSKTSSFSVSPTMLDMTITAPAGYEVRENGTATFGTSLTYTSVTGNIPTKNIEVRIASTTVAGSPAGNLTCSSNGALQKSIALTGTVFPLTPTVTTQAVTAISTTGATLNASVNANNASTTVTFEYGLTTSYGTTVTASQSPATGNTATAVSYVLSGLTPNTVYHFRVNTVNSAGTTPGNDLIFTTSYGSQVINFSSLTDKTYGDADFNPEATSATSGINPITYTSSNEAVATIVNSQIHIVGFGSTNITAKQAGNANYTAAADVTKQLIVNKRSITITADAKSKTYGDADPSLTAQVTSGTIVIGDNASGSLTRATGETATDYVISQGTYSYGSNYTETFVPAYLTIGKRAITLTAVADTKTYDGTTVSTAIPTVGALLTGDEINTAPTQAFDNASVGTTHVLTASVLTIKNSSIDVTDNYDISYVAANGNITAKALTINTPTVTLSKVYDGNTVAAVTTGTLSGIVTSDAGNVTVTAVASYDNATIGTNKTIRVVYTLGGSAAGNYSAPADYLARGAEISSGTITLEPLSNPTPNATSNDLVLSYTVVTGGPTQYQITFEAAALAVGIQNVSYTALATTGADGSITITVPEGTRPGKYKGTLQMRNDSGVESTAYDFVMTVNIPTEYIAVKYNKVLILDNSTKMFSAYQWYKDGVAIEGATKQFYSDPKGLVGTYTVKATTTDGEVLYSYPKVLNIPLTQKVTAYPSLVRANQTCTVEITDGATDLDLTGAELSVYSSQGIRVYHSTKVEKLNTIKLPTMDGMYSGHVTTANGQSFPFKVIVAN